MREQSCGCEPVGAVAESLLDLLASFEPRVHEPDHCVPLGTLLSRSEKACAAARLQAAARAAESGAQRTKVFVRPSDIGADATSTG